jgi:hypothetical protein
VQFEPAGVAYGIPSVGLPIRGYGGRIVGANGMIISTPCPHKLASERLVQTASGLLPVVGVDFRGPWQVGYATTVRVSPAGIATLPDGSHVRVPLRGGYPARAGAQRVGEDATVLHSWDALAGDVPTKPVADLNPTTLNATNDTPRGLILSADGEDVAGDNPGTILGPAGTSSTSATPGGDVGLAAKFSGTPPGLFDGFSLPSWGQVTTILVCVLVGVGLWFLWPVIAGVRRMI